MDGVICEFNSRTGESKDSIKASKKPINSFTISHDEKFMGISSKITRLFSVNEKREILRIPSGADPIQMMSVSDDGRFLVSCGENHKEVQVWSCDHDSCITVSTASLAMQNQPKLLDCTKSSSYGDGGIVLAVSKKGVVHVWHLQTLSQDEVMPTKISVKNSHDKKGRIPIISAKLCDANEDNTVKVHVAFVSPNILQFKVVDLDDTCKDINLVAEYDTLALQDMVSPQERDLVQETKAPANNKEAAEPVLQESANPCHQGKTNKRMSSVLDCTNDTIKEVNPEYSLDEPTMEEKLASLNLLNKSEITKEQSPSLAPPSADSVHILLKQALRADDHTELLKCLYNRDEKVIVKSISLLTPTDVVKLLKFSVLLIQSRGATLVCLLPWLQALLCRHMSCILSQDSSLMLLNSLYQLIDARTSTFKSALQLSTSLDYLLSEFPDEESDDEATPPIIYEDKDTDDEDSEVDAMETDGESQDQELGDVTDASEHSDGIPIAAEIFKKAGTYDEKRLFGVTTLDVVRSKTFYAGKANVPVTDVNVPVVGGHAGITILTLFSQETLETNALSYEDIKALTKRTQDGGTEVVEAKAGKGSATLSMVYAGAVFANACLKGLNGVPDIIECSFVQSTVTELPFFASKVKLGKNGVEQVLGLGELSGFEKEGLENLKGELKASIEKGIKFANEN
ncbi:hypothetical protein GUJ93_ZPchr0007g3507 [Zizania palustris]|nr:hypothetical protein GUJ93_ZPchr0007g3507 [Zizania palustris]